MGNKVSRVYGAVIKRPMQRFNIEHRAEKVITKSQDQEAAPVRAPMYKTDADLLDEIRKTKPEVAESAVKRDHELHDRLRSVFVTSTDPDTEGQSDPDPDRPLPLDRRQYSYDFVPGHMRAERKGRVIPRGKITLEQTVDFLTKHKETDGSYDHGAVADQYRINPATAANTLKYFQIFGMIEPKTRERESDPPDPLTAGVDWVEVTKPGIVKVQEEQRQIIAQINAAKEKSSVRRRPERMLQEGETKDRT